MIRRMSEEREEEEKKINIGNSENTDNYAEGDRDDHDDDNRDTLTRNLCKFQLSRHHVMCFDHPGDPRSSPSLQKAAKPMATEIHSVH